MNLWKAHESRLVAPQDRVDITIREGSLCPHWVRLMDMEVCQVGDDFITAFPREAKEPITIVSPPRMSHHHCGCGWGMNCFDVYTPLQLKFDNETLAIGDKISPIASHCRDHDPDLAICEVRAIRQGSIVVTTISGNRIKIVIPELADTLEEACRHTMDDFTWLKPKQATT